jgi:hypothetical protein
MVAPGRRMIRNGVVTAPAHSVVYDFRLWRWFCGNRPRRRPKFNLQLSEPGPLEPQPTRFFCELRQCHGNSGITRPSAIAFSRSIRLTSLANNWSSTFGTAGNGFSSQWCALR